MEISGTLTPLLSFLQPFLSLLSDDPVLRSLQGALLLSACFLAFLVLFATKDILQRTSSFALQFVSIVLVACFPVGGFLLYLLIRPGRTLHEKQMANELAALRVLLDVRNEPVSSPKERVDSAKQTLLAVVEKKEQTTFEVKKMAQTTLEAEKKEHTTDGKESIPAEAVVSSVL